MSSKHLFRIFTVVGAALLLSRSVAMSRSVLVSNPSWQFLGPQPITGVQANYGGIVLTGASFHATGRVTSIAVDSTALGTCGPSPHQPAVTLVAKPKSDQRAIRRPPRSTAGISFMAS